MPPCRFVGFAAAVSIKPIESIDDLTAVAFFASPTFFFEKGDFSIRSGKINSFNNTMTMASSLKISLGQGLVSRRASSFQSKPIAARQRLVIRATAGDQFVHSLVNSMYNIENERRGDQSSLGSKQTTYRLNSILFLYLQKLTLPKSTRLSRS
jgi:hypothetical protein